MEWRADSQAARYEHALDRDHRELHGHTAANKVLLAHQNLDQEPQQEPRDGEGIPERGAELWGETSSVVEPEHGFQ